MKLGQWLRIIISGVVTALFLWLLLRRIELDSAMYMLSAADPKWIVAALIACSCSFACRVQRWRALMIPGNPALKWSTCAGPLLAGFFGNNVLPFRAGDILRAFAFTRELGLSSGSVLATLVAERLLDVLVVLGLFSAALLVLPTHTAPLDITIVALATMIALVLWGMLFQPRLFSRLSPALLGCAFKVSPKFSNWLRTESGRAFATFEYLSRMRSMAEPASWSVAAWLIDATAFWFLACSLDAITVPSASWLALPSGALSSLIPSTPGNVGTFDYVVARAMIESGNLPLEATAYALLAHVTMWLPQTMCGGLFLALRAIKRKCAPTSGSTLSRSLEIHETRK